MTKGYIPSAVPGIYRVVLNNGNERIVEALSSMQAKRIAERREGNEHFAVRVIRESDVREIVEKKKRLEKEIKVLRRMEKSVE